jgi:hypothetical protein
MSRILTLSGFVLRDFSRSLWVIVPPGLTLALYRVFFLYGSDVPYFASIGAIILGLACLATTLLLANMANRASTYALLARVPQRTELIAAIAASAFGITVVLAVLFTAGIGLSGQVPLTPAVLLEIAPRWVAVFLFVIAFGLHLSKLVSRSGSNLIAYVFLILAAVSYEPLEYPDTPLLNAAQRLTLDALHPVTSILLGDVNLLQSILMICLTLFYAAVLFALATWLFHRKDLLWAE